MPDRLKGRLFPSIKSGTDGSADPGRAKRYRVCYALGVKTNKGVRQI